MPDPRHWDRWKPGFKGRRFLMLVCCCVAAFLAGRWTSASREGLSTARHDATAPGSGTSPSVRRAFRGSSASHPPNLGDPLPDDSGRSEADVMEMKRLHEARKRGEYVLDMEEPGFRLAHRETVGAFVTNAAAERQANEYLAILERLGVPPDRAQLLVVHVSKIAMASAEANQYLIDLLDAQAAYDKSLRSILSEENYLKYREYETSVRVSKEAAALSSFLADRRVSVTSEDAALVEALFRETGARTMEFSFGPYDPPPSPRVGPEQVRQGLEANLEREAQAASAMASAARDRGLAPEITQAIVDYFAERRRGFETQIAEMAEWEQKGSKAMIEKIKARAGPRR